MSDVRKFKFVSPGIFLNEIDQSERAQDLAPAGPVIIGRTERGPGMRPVVVNSFAEYVETFGNPIPGGESTDVWRNGSYSAPTYAGFAAQAYLRNNAPVTIVRLVGHQHGKASTTTVQDSGKAGWGGAMDVSTSDAKGAYGLFVMASSSNGTEPFNQTASLAAVWYMTSDAAITLSGTMMKSVSTVLQNTASHACVVATSSATANGEFIALIGTPAEITANTAKRYVFNFNRDSANYIRNVFNTNPQKTNSNITATVEKHWLGETYERSLLDGARTGVNTPNDITHGVMLGLQTDDSTAKDWADNQREAEVARTGWIIAQDTGNAANFNPYKMQKLFRLVGLDASGDWLQKNLKVSIQNIRPPSSLDPGVPSYGTFTVVLRKIGDQDTAPSIVEMYTGCDLDPNSSNYIARQIGDRYAEWDDSKKYHREYGKYENMSRFIRVEMHPDVENGEAVGLVPFGFHGPPTLRTDGENVKTADITSTTFLQTNDETYLPNFSHAGTALSTDRPVITGRDGTTAFTLTASYLFPRAVLRYASNQVGSNFMKPQQAYFGIDVAQSGTVKYDPSTPDLLRPLPAGLVTYSAASDDASAGVVDPSHIFTLDNLVVPGTASKDFTVAKYISGSRANPAPGTVGSGPTSVSSLSGAYFLLTGSDFGYDKFTTVFHGGFDGLDITEADPFRNTRLSATETEIGNYAFYSVRRAIDTVRDPDRVTTNMMVMPGITNPTLTEHMISTCEERADALAIIDLEKDYIPAHDSSAAENASGRRPDVDTAINKLRNRKINSSYGACYYPSVQIRDTLSNKILTVPPSVVALGAMSYSEATRALWFAPAGFTRGGLSTGTSGLTVLAAKHHLSSEERDRLYEVNINPVASFPAEGVVIFGQKTLQATPSALDRINVRRLLIHIKREVSKIAATTLFEQNVRATWNGFSSEVTVLLNDIKAGLGLVDFKVVLDETTTTPDLVDRNILYAKIFLKPALAIEFIALDFIITDSGASFAD